MRSYPARLDAEGLRFAIVVSRFNHLISARLLAGTAQELAERGCGADDVHVAWVPGAFEIPLAAQRLARSGNVDAVVCLGAVIRGATAHFEHVAGQAASGVARVALETDVPVTFGILTTDTTEQALARAGGAEGNKGCDAARAAIEMARLVRAVARPPGGPRARAPSRGRPARRTRRR